MGSLQHYHKHFKNVSDIFRTSGIQTVTSEPSLKIKFAKSVAGADTS